MKVLGREVAGGKESSAFFGSTHRTLVRVGGVLLGLTNCSDPCNILLAPSFTLYISKRNVQSPICIYIFKRHKTPEHTSKADQLPLQYSQNKMFHQQI